MNRVQQRKRKQRIRTALIVGGVLTVLGVIAGLSAIGADSEETAASHYIEDISLSGELDEFTVSTMARAWIDAGRHDRPLRVFTVGGDTTDFLEVTSVAPDLPCETETTSCLEEIDASAISYVTEAQASLAGPGAHGSDLVAPLVELAGAHGTVFYVTDGCISTSEPRRELCRDLPANEGEARRIADALVSEYGLEGALADLDALYLVGIGSTADGGETAGAGTLLRTTWTLLAEAGGVDADRIHVSAGLPTY